MSERDYVKEAEQNVLNRARDMDMSMRLFDAFTAKYSRNMPERHRKEFGERMKSVREVLYTVYGEAITELFMFTALGGDEVTEYAREQMRKRFRDEPNEIKYAIMGLLERNGDASWYYSEDEEGFRSQVNEELNGK